MHTLLELGATVEELFGIEYNEMHNLVEQETSPASSSEKLNQLQQKMQQLEKRLTEIENFARKNSNPKNCPKKSV